VLLHIVHPGLVRNLAVLAYYHLAKSRKIYRIESGTGIVDDPWTVLVRIVAIQQGVGEVGYKA
jgi:hypothetical protein